MRIFHFGKYPAFLLYWKALEFRYFTTESFLTHRSCSCFIFSTGVKLRRPNDINLSSSDLITADIGTSDELRFERIDLQSDQTVKEIFNAVTLADFYKFAETFPCMKRFPGKTFSIFGSTYICEQSIFLNEDNNNNNVQNLYSALYNL